MQQQKTHTLIKLAIYSLIFINTDLWFLILYHHLFQCSYCPRFDQCEPLQWGFCVLLTCGHHSLIISCLLSQCCFLFADTLSQSHSGSHTLPRISLPLPHSSIPCHLPPWTCSLLCFKCDPQARLPSSYLGVDVCFVLVELKAVPVGSSFHVDAPCKLLNCWHAMPGSCYA